MRMPAVLIPYSGSCNDYGCQDVFVYLRPETNGVLVESTLLRIIERNPQYKNNMSLVYLANLPGEFILEHHIVEEHYRVKLLYAVRGKDVFTAYMKQRFSEFFKTPFEQARIVGAYEAIRMLHMNPEELLNIWVPQNEVLYVDGQCIKRLNDMYIVNYDIPALLHRNAKGTDIAVMIFRTPLAYKDFNRAIEEMRLALIREDVLDPEKPVSRVFHYSKGPFEQVLDGIGYLYNRDASHVPLEDISFVAFLMRNGVSLDTILGLVRYPIMQFRTPQGIVVEDTIFSYTTDDTYEQAMEKTKNIVSQFILRGV